MRCVVHVRKSFGFGEQHFVVRLSPLFVLGQRRSESVSSVRALGERLTALGVPKMDVETSFPDLGGYLDAVWTNVEVPDAVFEGFGKSHGASVADREPVAA